MVVTVCQCKIWHKQLEVLWVRGGAAAPGRQRTAYSLSLKKVQMKKWGSKIMNSFEEFRDNSRQCPSDSRLRTGPPILLELSFRGKQHGFVIRQP